MILFKGGLMGDDSFFRSQDAQNFIKTKIVTDYFDAWSKIMLTKTHDAQQRIAYIDLFAGAGRFDDGEPSTPLRILRAAIDDPKLSRQLVTQFNDKNPLYASKLQREIAALEGIASLRFPPAVSNKTVGPELVNLLSGLRLVPTLFFIDPWGYKGLSLDLVGAAIKSWGCDCIFFFNYNRVNPGINNNIVADHMADLFGDERFAQLREAIVGSDPDKRQTLIVETLASALDEVGGRFVLPFEFESEHGKRPSHYVVFVSKHFLGYHIMKEVMVKLSSDDEDVSKFQLLATKSMQMELFSDLGRPHTLTALKGKIVSSLSGRSERVWSVYEFVSPGTPYTLKNVQDALIALEHEGRISVDIPAARRPKRHGRATLGRERIVTLPT